MPSRRGIIQRLRDRFTKAAPQPKMYVLVRSDLLPGLQMAQAIHAASYLASSDNIALFQHPTVVVLNVRDEKHLIEMAGRHVRLPATPAQIVFTEPDLGGAATAMACYSTGEEFRGLPLALRNVGAT